MKQKKTSIRFLLSAITVLLFSHCSKNSLQQKELDVLKGSKNMSAQTTLVDPTVYVVGWDETGNYTSAKYWVNGVEHVLSTNSAQAFAIAIYGNDVYIGGQVHDTAVYWKNGVRFNLPKATGWSAPAVKGITVSAGQVYATGVSTTTPGSFTLAVYWSPTGYGVLPTGNPYGGNVGAAIAVSGSDVHIAGSYSDGGAYWKNGVMSVPTNSYQLTAIALNGSDVYFAGRAMSGKPAYWKNGVLTTLATAGPYPAANGDATGVAISGTNVYVSGDTWGMGAQYWQNGYIGTLPSTTVNSMANAIAVNGSDVYIAGYDEVPTLYKQVKYWKNGVGYALTSGTTANAYGCGIALK